MPDPQARRHAWPTVGAAFLLYGALFTDRLAPLFLATRLAAHHDVGQVGLAALPFAIAAGWTLGLAAARVCNRWLSLRQRVVFGAVVTAVMALASVLAPNWTLFLLLRALGGVAANVAAPALIALCVRLTPVARRGTVLGIVLSSTRIAGSFAAPMILTLVLAAAGWRAALLVPPALLLVSALTAHVLLPPAPTETGASRRPVYHRHGRRILAVASAAAVLSMCWLTLVSQAGLPLLESWLGVDVVTAGRLLAGFGLGSTLGALGIAAWSDRGRARALAWAALTTAVGGTWLAVAALLDAAPAPWQVALAVGVSGVGLGVLPLAVSILPADAVRTGDVDRAVELPIISAELLGAAALPAAALALAPGVEVAWALLATAVGFAVLAAVGAPILHRALAVTAALSPADPSRR